MRFPNDVYKEEEERVWLVSLWVDELLKCPSHTLTTVYTPVAEAFTLFVRAACVPGGARQREVVEALTRLVTEDDRRGNCELAY